MLQVAQGENDWVFNGDLSVGRVGWQEGGQRDTIDTGVLRLTHRLQASKNAWVVTALNLDWAGLTLTGSGRVERVGDVLHLDLKVEEPRLDLGTTKLRDAANLPLDVTGMASVKVAVVGALNLDVTPAQYPEMRAAVSLSNIKVSGGAMTQETRVDTASVSLSEGVLQLVLLKGKAFGGQVLASGQVSPIWPPNVDKRLQINLEAKMDVLDMGALFPTESPPIEGDQTSGVLQGMRVADARLDVAIDSLVIDNTRLTDFKAIAVAKDGILHVDSIRANIMGGVMTAQTEIDGRAKSLVPVRATASLSNIQAERFLQGYMRWSIPVFGQMGVGIKMDGQMDST